MLARFIWDVIYPLVYVGRATEFRLGILGMAVEGEGDEWCDKPSQTDGSDGSLSRKSYTDAASVH
jgi:hypothetical protein